MSKSSFLIKKLLQLTPWSGSLPSDSEDGDMLYASLDSFKLKHGGQWANLLGFRDEQVISGGIYTSLTWSTPNIQHFRTISIAPGDSSPVVIHGIPLAAAGHSFTILNQTSFQMQVVHNSGTEPGFFTKIYTSSGANIFINPNESITLVTSGFGWYQIGSTGGSTVKSMASTGLSLSWNPSKDMYLVDTTLSNVTLTLPTTPVPGKVLTAKKVVTGVNSVVLSPVSGTIDGGATLAFNTAYESVDVVFDGTNWWSI